ncbi:hypothetical protein, partial [Hymenobacter jeollabukensis]
MLKPLLEQITAVQYLSAASASRWRAWWLAAGLLCLAFSARAQQQTIGSTTVPVVSPATSSPYYGPLYRFSATSTTINSRHAYLYTATELGIPTGSTITQLEWVKSDAGVATGNNTFNVWLGNSTSTTLTTGTSWATLTGLATQVYTSTAQQVSGAAGSFWGISPTAGSFTYTGGSLMILTDWALSSSANAPNAIEFVTNPATGLAIGTASTVALTNTTTLSSTTYGGRRPTLRISYTPGSPCTAPPTAGTTVSNISSACNGATANLSLQGASFGSGMTYQWQQSSNGTSYTNITGATAPAYTTNALTATTYFRAVLTCSGQSANSAPVTVTIAAPTYATLPYTQTFEADWIDVCATREVPSNSWRGTASPTDADASWRRDDDGAAGGWSTPTGGVYSPTGSQGAHSARFHSTWATAGTVGTLDLYANLSYNGDKILQFYYINTSGADSLTVHVSTDGGATFGPALLRLNQAATWTRQQLRLTNVISATAVIRFRGRGDFGSTDIGVDDLLLRTDAPCTAPPTAGSAVASLTSGCSGIVTNLSLQGNSVGSGLTYQWQQSSNGTTYTNITGATGETYTSGPLLATTYFRAVVTCSGQSANSAPVTVTIAAPTYAPLPYTQTFEADWIDVCATREVPSNSWRSTPDPTDADASWRRDDDGAAGGWGAVTSGAYTPAGATGSAHSARFHSYLASNNKVGTLDLYINLSQAGDKVLQFDYINTTGVSTTNNDSLTIHVSTDGGVTFGPALLRLGANYTDWSHQLLTLTNTTATTVIRFRGRSDFSLTDMGLDNVDIRSASACFAPASLTVGVVTS